MTAGSVRRKALTLLAAGALLAGLSAGPAAAQESATSPDALSETYGSWSLRCGAEGAGCHVFQALYRAKDKARLVQVTLFSPPDADGALLLRALTPLGAVLIEAAVLVVDDGAPTNISYISCWPRGCVAETALTPDLEAALRAGLTLAVLVVSAENGQTIRFELSLDGITRALDRLRGM